MTWFLLAIFFTRGMVIKTSFDRVTTTENGLAINPAWVTYEAEIRDLTNPDDWYLFRTTDLNVITKKTAGFIVGHVYQHRIQAVVAERHIINDSTVVEGFSKWALSPIYQIMAQGNGRQKLLIR